MQILVIPPSHNQDFINLKEKKKQLIHTQEETQICIPHYLFGVL